jgi:hypothetical protein
MDKIVAIRVSRLANGRQAPNQFPGWDSPETTVFESGGYGGAPRTKYLATPDTSKFIARTTEASRDQEVTTFAERCSIVLRLTRSGACFVFSCSTETNSYSVGYFEGVKEGVANPTGVGPGGGAMKSNRFAVPLPPLTSVPGWDPQDTAGKAWTFGVEGFEIYLKFQGLEIWRSTQFFHLESGRMALGGHPNARSYGVRDVEAKHLPDKPLYSDLARKVFDLRDFGMKSLMTTGTISAGADLLHVADAGGFSVGDRICIGVGGEVAGGVPGERGVGGCWPNLLYASVSVRDSDNTQPRGKVSGVLETGETAMWSGSRWVRYAGNLDKYLQKILPRAHVATIVAIAGNVFRLDKPGVAGTVDAPVRFDSSLRMASTLAAPDSGLRLQEGCTISVPPGKDWTFANSSPSFNRLPGLRIVGAGRDKTSVVSPRGTRATGFYITESPGFVVSDIEFVGNARSDAGYMFTFHPTLDHWTGVGEFIRGSTSDRALITRIRGINHGLSCVGLNYCSNGLIKDIQVIHETGHKQYFQWSVGCADSDNCVVEDITFNCPNLLKGLETFRSSRTTLRRATGRNAVFSSNSSTNSMFEDCDIVYEPGAGYAGIDGQFSAGSNNPSPLEPLVNLNSNIDNTSGSATGTTVLVRNCNFDVRGRLFPPGYGVLVIGISGSVDKVTVSGRYPAKPEPRPGGLIRLPDLGADIAMAIRCDEPGKSVTVDGVRIVSRSRTPPVGGFLGGTLHPGQTIRNCVIDRLPPTIRGKVENTITNEAYDAL